VADVTMVLRSARERIEEEVSPVLQNTRRILLLTARDSDP